MNYPLYIDTIRMELSNMYFKGFIVKISIKRCISVSEDFFIFANSADPDVMLLYAILAKSADLCSILSWSSLFAKEPVYWYPE